MFLIDGIALNKTLLDKQNAWSNVQEIADLHHFKLNIYSLLDETNDKKLIKSLALDLREIEFELQKLWGFSEDANYHRIWEYPKCLCGELDNRDAYPYQQYINANCPLHGD